MDTKQSAQKPTSATSAELENEIRGVFLRGVLIGQKARFIKPFEDKDTKRMLPACIKVISEIALDEGTAKVAEKYDLGATGFKVDGEEVKEFPKRELFSAVHVRVSLFCAPSRDGKTANVYYSRPEFLAV